jgi:hypothetical protein
MKVLQRNVGPAIRYGWLERFVVIRPFGLAFFLAREIFRSLIRLITFRSRSSAGWFFVERWDLLVTGGGRLRRYRRRP